MHPSMGIGRAKQHEQKSNAKQGDLRMLLAIVRVRNTKQSALIEYTQRNTYEQRIDL